MLWRGIKTEFLERGILIPINPKLLPAGSTIYLQLFCKVRPRNGTIGWASWEHTPQSTLPGTVSDLAQSILLPNCELSKMTMQSFAVSLPNNTLSPIRLAGIPHIVFETWVDRFPRVIAVTGERGTLTYLEVEQRANQIAHALRSAGVQKGDSVALFLERGPDLVCALLGILKSGAGLCGVGP